MATRSRMGAHLQSLGYNCVLLFVSFILLSCFTNPDAVAEQSYHISGKMLLCRCQDTLAMMHASKHYNVSRSSWCIGFIQGMVNAHRFYSVLHTLEGNQDNVQPVKQHRIQPTLTYHIYCIPVSVTLGNIVTHVITFLNTHRIYQQESAGMAITRALYHQYPCT